MLYFKNLNKLVCPICESESNYLFTSKHNRQIFNCKNSDCDHFFTPLQSLNQGVCSRISEIEYESNKSLSVFNERNTRLLNLFLNNLTQIDSTINLLDFGAGNAHISRTFKNYLGDRSSIYCYEPNHICQLLYEKYQLIHITNLKNISKEIDLIYMIEVIEHLQDPISTLRELAGLLQKNGKIFISTPIGCRYEHLTNAYDTESHLHFFSEKSLNLALRKSGLETISYKYFSEMYPLNSGMNLFKKIKAFLRFIHSKTFQILGMKNSLEHLVGFTEPIKKNFNEPNIAPTKSFN